MDKNNGKYLLILSVICCVISAACLLRLGALEKKIENINQDLGNSVNRLQGAISGVSGMVDQRLSEQGNLLVSSEYALDEPDYANQTIRMTYTVVPKEYSPADTEAVLICGGEEYVMELEDGIYTAELVIPMLTETGVSAVQFLENGTVRTQALNMQVNPRQEYLGTVYADYMGGWTSVKKEEGHTELAYDGAVDITIERGRRAKNPVSVVLHAYVDGEEVSARTLRSWPEDGSAKAAEGQMDPEDMYGEPDHMKCSFEENYQVPFGSTLELVTSVSMDDGLEYRNLIQRESFDETGEPEVDNRPEDMNWEGVEASIYDSKGRLLFDALDMTR